MNSCIRCTSTACNTHLFGCGLMMSAGDGWYCLMYAGKEYCVFILYMLLWFYLKGEGKRGFYGWANIFRRRHEKVLGGYKNKKGIWEFHKRSLDRPLRFSLSLLFTGIYKSTIFIVVVACAATGRSGRRYGWSRHVF